MKVKKFWEVIVLSKLKNCWLKFDGVAPRFFDRLHEAKEFATDLELQLSPNLEKKIIIKEINFYEA